MKLDEFGYVKSVQTQPDPKQVQLATDAISEMGFTKIKNVNLNYSSYGLKHICEGYIRYVMKHDGNPYIANGAFIAAMLNHGYDTRIKAPNAWFNVSSRDIKRVDKEVRKGRGYTRWS